MLLVTRSNVLGYRQEAAINGTEDMASGHQDEPEEDAPNAAREVFSTEIGSRESTRDTSSS